MALKYLTESLNIEMQIEDNKISLASTHLNICAILSSTGKHKKAYQHSKQALELLESQENNTKYTSNLAVAYYNCAVELEFLFRHQQALMYYKTGLDISVKKLGLDNPITKTFLKALQKSQCIKPLSLESHRNFNQTNSFSKIHQNLPSINSCRMKSSHYSASHKKMRKTSKSFFT